MLATSGLSKRHCVIAVDWPGFCRAEPPASPPTYNAEVERIGELADSFGLDRFNLVAHDFGGFLGLGYVLRHRDRVTWLALLNTVAHSVFRPRFYRRSLGQHWSAMHTQAAMRRLPLRRLHHLVLRPHRTLGCFDDALEDEHLGWTDTPRGRRTFVELLRSYHLPAVPEPAAGLGRIAGPTAVIRGDRDRYIPFTTATQLAEQIPGATLTRLTGGDHHITEERPDEVTATLAELLARAV